MQIDEDEYLAHYGILRKSGRYPWGSGEDQSTRNRDFLAAVDEMKKQGLSDVEICRGFGISTTQLRAAKSIAKTEQKQAQIFEAQRLKDKGMSNVAIGEKMGLNESSVRALLVPGAQVKADVLEATAAILREQVKEKTYLDVGSGVEAHMDISTTKLNTTLAFLKEEGYEVHDLKIQQPGTGKFTNYKILCPPGTTRTEVFLNRDKVQQFNAFSNDGGRGYLGVRPPLSIDSKRVGIIYDEDGGSAADGVMYVRPGVKDVSLDGSRYAQVRVAVDGTHYIKGMAMYKDGLPDGIDIQFNTNKKNTGNKLDALKKMSDDPDNPFGAVLKRQVLDGPTRDPNTKVTSVMNIVNEEGDWAKWSKTLSAQMLSKQPLSLAKSQLDQTYEARKKEFDEIASLTNPTVKRKLLEGFSDGTDAAAVHLKAAALPKQASHVILPVPSIKPDQVFAPNYADGTRVVLIRYPHGGTFEIPELVVNNRHPESKKLLTGARDAIGIHPSVAERLSGADFDGDTVLVIPNDTNRVKHTAALEGLKDFNSKQYKLPEGAPKMSAKTKAIQMGDVSNLITDMTIKAAPPDEIARAVKHSMVVIDAEKHHLDYKQSAIDFGIKSLKEKYQGGARKGATTLISRASSEIAVPQIKLRSAKDGGPIDKTTGALVYEPTNAKRINGSGKEVDLLTKTTRLGNTNDAFTLSSGTQMERIYAEHSNKLKALANQARLESVNTPNLKYSPSAKLAYAEEVKSLDAKLAIAIRNRPLERQALVVANTIIKMKRDAQPDMDATQLKKIKGQALTEARLRTGAGKEQIVFTDREWEAIQAGAISENKLSQMLNNADLDRVRALATPKTQKTISTAMASKARTMLANGHTQADVAMALGVSTTTLDRALNTTEG